MCFLRVENVSKSYGAIRVLAKIDLAVQKGEFVALVGPSGCGKSTLLRVLAGLEQLSSGDIFIDGQNVNNTAPRDRDIAMVFQNYALYPHLSVRENLGFAMKMRSMDTAEITKRGEEVAKMLGLESLLDRLPKQLSGGQRQRVAMGRAIMRKPKLFLFDEPLSNLDAKLRVQMRLEISTLHRRLGATSIFVTHDQVEAMTMADRIVLLNDGVIQQIGTPQELYHQPANQFVATFIGAPTMNIIQLERCSDGSVHAKGFMLPTELGANHDHSMTFGLRPEAISIGNAVGSPWPAKVVAIENLGFQSFVFCAVADGTILCALTNEDSTFATGQQVGLYPNVNKAHYFNRLGKRITE
jgi:multiple sugar transport system ATP-binding protein